LLLSTSTILLLKFSASGSVGLHFVDLVLLVFETGFLFGVSTTFGPSIGSYTFDFEDRPVIKILKLLHGIGQSLSVH
jgi:hypothetical protein